MGNTQSGGAPGGPLSKKDAERLQRRFQRLAGPGNLLSISTLTQQPEMGANPFTTRIFQIFDKDGDGKLSLEEFKEALEFFGRLSSPDKQYEFAFMVYDLDGDKLLSGTELFRTLQTMLGRAYPEAQLEQIVTNTLLEYDKDGDGCLNFEEFKALIGSKDLANKFSLAL